ncbi:MAG: ABC transporter permease [Candidatus Eisenbacteria bacterium]|nr:ABC transporter permease [Candidatus Eisenbacteria bacterium]
MKFMAILRVGLRALARNKMRSLLTMLGIIIGVGAVIAMISIADGARAQVQSQIASMGTNILMVFPGSVTQGGVRSGFGSITTMTADDAVAILREAPSVARIAPTTRTVAQVIAGNQNWSTQIQGAGADYFDIRDWPVEQGLPFTDLDVRSSAKACVLGTTVADNLFPGQDPVGQVVRINKVPFQILGVMKKKGGNAMGSDQDDIIVVPYTTAQKRLQGISHIQGMMISAVGKEQVATAQTEITQILRRRHRIAPGGNDDFMIRAQSDIAATADETSKVMTMLLGAIASVSLLVGGIGIMNIMLVSVTERIREIGIRMAVGARPGDILLQFLLEAIILSTLGGLIGVGLGIGISQIVSKAAGWSVLIAPPAVAMAFGFAVAIGVFFGFYPARKAALLDPIEALRYE